MKQFQQAQPKVDSASVSVEENPSNEMNEEQAAIALTMVATVAVIAARIGIFQPKKIQPVALSCKLEAMMDEQNNGFDRGPGAGF